MNSSTVDEPEKQSSKEPMAIIRTGIFLYIAIAETLLTIGMFIREILITIGIESQNIDLYTEIAQLLLLIVFGPLIVKMIRNIIKKGDAQIDKLISYCILVLAGTVVLTLLHNYTLIYLFPKSYWTNLESYDNYYCSNPGGWGSYYFSIVKYIVIGILFSTRKE
jgi:hypothetical protein